MKYRLFTPERGSLEVGVNDEEYKGIDRLMKFQSKHISSASFCVRVCNPQVRCRCASRCEQIRLSCLIEQKERFWVARRLRQSQYNVSVFNAWTYALVGYVYIAAR